MGQVSCEKTLALAWSQQQSQGLACPQGCLGLRRWQMPTLSSLPPLSAIPACQGGQLRSGQGSCPWHTDVDLSAETGSLGSKSRTSPHRSTVQHPAEAGWQQSQHHRISVEDSLPGLRPYPTGWQQVVRHRCHSAGLRVSSRCTACL